MKINISAAVASLASLLAALAIPAFATTYETPSTGNTLLGTTTYTTVAGGETLIQIAQKYDLGLNAILDANQGIPGDAHLLPGTHVQIPTSYLLPPLAHNGIVINLPEMRLYYYTPGGGIKTYPIGIGRVGKTIPLTRTAVIRKVKNPVWIPPEDIRAFNEQQGVVLPKVIPAGPDNPLGPYAVYLSLPTYLIHSTIFPDSIGRRLSFGCIRMNETDIKDFYPILTTGTEVTIVDMPSKAGWQNKTLLLEVHAPLEEHSKEFYATYQGLVSLIDNSMQRKPAMVDWQLVLDLSQNPDGLPHDVGYRLK